MRTVQVDRGFLVNGKAIVNGQEIKVGAIIDLPDDLAGMMFSVGKVHFVQKPEPPPTPKQEIPEEPKEEAEPPSRGKGAKK